MSLHSASSSQKIEAMGPRGYLESMSYRDDDSPTRVRLDDEDVASDAGAESVLDDEGEEG